MKVFAGFAAVFVAAIWGHMAWAQTWVQIEARPNQALGMERAADYARRLPDVNGFRLNSGWFAVALGPYSEAEAQANLGQLRAAGAIPSDSFLSDGSNFSDRFFGTGEATGAGLQPQVPLTPLAPGEETEAEARASERLLTREERELIQTAMKWDGFYNSVIDGAFGPGTRRAMADWQQANGIEPTGTLTSRQRGDLTNAYLEARNSLGLTPVVDAEAGIEITLPGALVRFDRYEAPFAHYEAATGDGVRVVLISQAGDRNTMTALFDIMQTLEVVPMNGERTLGNEEFTLTGQDAEVISHTFVRSVRDTVKGFTLIWPASDAKRFQLALTAMQESFRPGSQVLPDTMGAGAAQDIDLLSGLEIRRPMITRSGFYVDAGGSVLTSTDAVRTCGRITLDDETEADVVATDDALGLALLRPRETLAPMSVARLAALEPRIQSDVAVAGYPFGGILSAPTLTYGTLADVKGLDGDTRVARLEIPSEDSDAGGPVFDGSGAVVGMLMTRGESARQLPGSVAFAANALALAEFLSANGISALASDTATAIAPEDLTVLARDMTVLVSCWN